jgi:hypothetical protein
MLDSANEVERKNDEHVVGPERQGMMMMMQAAST